MAKINWNNFNIAIDKPIQRATRQIATRLANERFEEVKDEFLDKFMNDRTTQEIIGEKTKKPPKEQKGGKSYIAGTLFGFIGFKENSDPIGELFNFLNDSIQIQKVGEYDNIRKQYIFRVFIPTKDDIKKETPMPWPQTSRSWAFAIESGISGLNRYYYKSAGRSGQGIQAKGILPSAQGSVFTPRKYMSNLLKFLTNAFK